jgi:hypothetical protein
MIVPSSLIGILVDIKKEHFLDDKKKRLQGDKSLLRAFVLASSQNPFSYSTP